ncbi:hypothetical protein ACJX0J_030984, partial [Zea mays]
MKDAYKHLKIGQQASTPYYSFEFHLNESLLILKFKAAKNRDALLLLILYIAISTEENLDDINIFMLALGSKKVQETLSDKLSKEIIMLLHKYTNLYMLKWGILLVAEKIHDAEQVVWDFLHLWSL